MRTTPSDAVRAGLQIVTTARPVPAAPGGRLPVRVGIATGLVVVGDLIGAGESQERGVVGETPNLAARLQTLAEPDCVVIDANTQQLTRGIFEYEELGAVELKGFIEPVRAWRVRGESTIESRFEALHSAAALTRLVGREDEIELLARRWMQAKSGAGQVILLSGEPGIGKSRLTAALQERLRDEPHVRLRYFCSAHHQDSALHPTIVQLERAAGFERGDTPEMKLRKLEALLAPTSSPIAGLPLVAELLQHSRWRSVRSEPAKSAAQEGGDIRAAAPPARRPRAEPAGIHGLRGRPLDRPQLTRAPGSRGRSGSRSACVAADYIPARVSVAMDRPVARYDAHPQPPRPASGCDAGAAGRGRQGAARGIPWKRSSSAPTACRFSSRS